LLINSLKSLTRTLDSKSRKLSERIQGDNKLASYDTDEEQIEALKRWWHENGTSFMFSIALAVLVYIGVRYFEGYQENQVQQASALYQQLADLGQASAERAITAEEVVEASAVHLQLMEKYSGTVYPRLSALMLAKLEVDNDNLEAAIDHLQWILDNPSFGFFNSISNEVSLLTTLRLARVRLAQGQANVVLDLLTAVDDQYAYRAAFSELEGDAYVALGNNEAAISAYQKALLAQSESAGSSSGILQLKLANLGADIQGRL
jgi:predicted negative regulator of RcsB-dependent stress response